MYRDTVLKLKKQTYYNSKARSNRVSYELFYWSHAQDLQPTWFSDATEYCIYILKVIREIF